MLAYVKELIVFFVQLHCSWCDVSDELGLWH